jgi:hypothetical protein
VIEHDGRCDDDGTDEPCPICRGEVSPEFVERIKAAAAQPGQVMTIAEFNVWLRASTAG